MVIRKSVMIILLATMLFSSTFAILYAQGGAVEIEETVVTATSLEDDDPGGLVPCRNNCDFEDFMHMLSRILEFAIMLAIVITAVIFAWAGLKMVLSAGNVESRQAAKHMIKSATIGFIVVLLAWLIIETLFNSLGVIDDFNPFK